MNKDSKFQETRMRKMETLFEWTIKDFGLQPHPTMTSEVFDSSYTESRWSVQFHKQDSGPGYTFYLLPRANFGQRLTYHFSLHVENDQLIKEASGVYKNEKGWLFITEANLVKIDVLVIRVKIMELIQITTMDQASTSTNRHSFRSLSSDLSQLLENDKYCDLTLSLNERDIKVHGLILAAGSSVFAAMLEHDTTEKQTGRIKIKDFDADTIQLLVTYIYTREGPDFSKLDLNRSIDLLKAADKYDVEGLKNFVSTHLVSILDAGNATMLFRAADTHNDGQLRSKCLDFFCKVSLDLESIEDMKSYPEVMMAIIKALKK